jgi:hypothetical protein
VPFIVFAQNRAVDVVMCSARTSQPTFCSAWINNSSKFVFISHFSKNLVKPCSRTVQGRPRPFFCHPANVPLGCLTFCDVSLLDLLQLLFNNCLQFFMDYFELECYRWYNSHKGSATRNWLVGFRLLLDKRWAGTSGNYCFKWSGKSVKRLTLGKENNWGWWRF